MVGYREKHSPRRGGVSAFLLLALGLLLAAIALSVDISHLGQTRVEMHNAADAAALAAAAALVDDDLLTDPPHSMSGLVPRARAAALAYGRANPVLGKPLQLDPNTANAPDGDIVFGFYDTGEGRSFQPARDPDHPLINAVHITAQRTRARGNPAGMYFGRLFNLPHADVLASATAIVDRAVYGFRPAGRQPAPLLPLALRTDPTGLDAGSWENQILKPPPAQPPFARDGDGNPETPPSDRFWFDRRGGRFLSVPAEAPHGDGIREMEVRLPLAGQPLDLDDADGANGCIVQIGDADWSALCGQVAAGVTSRELAPWGSQLALDANGQLPLPGGSLLPEAGGPALGELLQALQIAQQSAEPRIWPLFSKVLNANEGRGTVMIEGFVAARLIRVQLATSGHGQEERRQLCLTLQPCQLATATALTGRPKPAAPIPGGQGERRSDADWHNPYICKVRLVE